MPVTIHLVRHAQGHHNLSIENEQLPDPDLTSLGSSQCAGVRASFHSHAKLTHLVSSPMRRTLHTCLQSFGPAPGDDDDFERTALLPVIALPELQEVSDSPCDTGSDVSPGLEREFAGKVDFARVPAGWNEKLSAESEWEPTAEKLEVRARKARVFFREIAAKAGASAAAGEGEGKDVHIAAVSHGGFMHFLTGDWYGIQPPKASSWENCEYRSYQFVDPTGQDPEARIQETEESWHARLGEIKKPTAEEQYELRRTYLRELAGFVKPGELAN